MKLRHYTFSILVVVIILLTGFLIFRNHYSDLSNSIPVGDQSVSAVNVSASSTVKLESLSVSDIAKHK